MHNPDRPQVDNLDAMPWVTDVYKRDIDVTRYNVPFLLYPSFVCYFDSWLPGAVHLLPVASDVERPRLAQALHRRRCCRDGACQGALPRCQRVLF